MASLTGNKIKDTYTSLLKVGDNGTIDSSAQALTDGAGNALGLTITNGGVIVVLRLFFKSSIWSSILINRV